MCIRDRDIEIQLPVGTLIYDAITNQVIADFDKHAQVFVVSKGGFGGRGNSNFATSTTVSYTHLTLPTSDLV